MKAIINLDKVKYPDVVTAKNGADVLENGAFVAAADIANVGDPIARYEFTVSEAGTYYLGSMKSGINLYYIEVVYDAE